MKGKEYIDLHSHTIYSDGSDTPESLMRAMHMSGVNLAAVTDHDTLASYPRAKAEADHYGFRIIPGVEISTTRYHILGLNVNPEHKKLLALLEHSQRLQVDQCRQRIDNLAAHGVPITLDKLRALYPDARLGTWNITMTMLGDVPCREYLTRMHGYLPVPREVHDYYLRNGGIGAKTKKNESIRSKEAIAAIHDAGGIAIVAHPFKEVKDIEQELGRLRVKGIDGLEIQLNFGDNNEPFRQYALEHGWTMTYGSDFHGAGYDRALLGRRENINAIDCEQLEKMLIAWK